MSSELTLRRIVLLRHGRTAWNAVKRVQGQSDTELDEVGVEQARSVAPAIAALSPAMVVSSDLARARVTAETVAKEAGLVPSYDERLREMHFGVFQGRTHTEIEADDPTAFARFRSGDWSGIDGGEQPDELAARVAAALHSLAKALEPGEVGVAVAHGGAIRAGITRFLGWPLETAQSMRGLGNCARVVLEERDTGGWVLGAYNLPPDFAPVGGVG